MKNEIDEMQVAINALRLELHEAVHKDVNARWINLRKAIEASKEE